MRAIIVIVIAERNQMGILKKLLIMRFWWGRMLVLFGAGTAASSAIALQIALAPLDTAPDDPVAYMLAHPWPGLAVGMIAEALIGYWLYRRLVRKYEKREPKELTPSLSSLGEFAFGALIGCGFISAVMGVLWLSGHYHPTGMHWTPGILLGLTLGLGAAFLEEPVFRGFLLRVVDSKWGAPIAITTTALVFGLIHVLNSLATGDVSIVGPIAIIVEALPFIAAYYATRRLWLAIGIHFAWNATLYGIFGMAASGIANIGGLIEGSLNGSALMTGGSFGPEGSIVTVIGAAALSAALFFVAMRNKNIKRKSQES